VKIFSEDGMCKVVEIPADMTARDLCQLLVYKSHCVDDNSWALVEHHPLLGLGKRHCSFTYTHMKRALTHTLANLHRNWAETFNTITFIHGCIDTHACWHAYKDKQFIFSRRHVFKDELMHIQYSVCIHRAITYLDLIKYNTATVWKAAEAVRCRANKEGKCH